MRIKEIWISEDASEEMIERCKLPEATIVFKRYTNPDHWVIVTEEE